MSEFNLKQVPVNGFTIVRSSNGRGGRGQRGKGGEIKRGGEGRKIEERNRTKIIIRCYPFHREISNGSPKSGKVKERPFATDPSSPPLPLITNLREENSRKLGL